MLKKIILLILLATGTFAVSAQVTGTPFIWQAKKTDLVVGAASRTGYCAQKYTDLLVSIINNGGRNSKGTFSFTISELVTPPATENIQFGVADPTAAMSNGDVVNNSDFTFTPTYDATNTYITSYLVTSKPGVIVSAYNYILIALPIKSITATSGTTTLTTTLPNGAGGDAVYTNNTLESTITYGSCTPINANNDSYTIAGGSNSSPANILDNDTFNGAAATLSNVTITQLSTTNNGVTIDPATGLVSVAPGTPAGTYQINYRITDQLDANNSSPAIVTVTVLATPAPDMTVVATSKFTVYLPNVRPATFYFKVSNLGSATSNGLITLKVNISAEPAQSVTYTLPAGWSLQGSVGLTYIFTTSTAYVTNDNDTITVVYNSAGGLNPNGTGMAIGEGVITVGSGGETNGANNTSEVSVMGGGN